MLCLVVLTWPFEFIGTEILALANTDLSVYDEVIMACADIYNNISTIL